MISDTDGVTNHAKMAGPAAHKQMKIIYGSL